ncbi:unnamed protein product [Linum trigynum]|uniref:Uncharacterized protein n=1 Tax=Linum trigynum TaxID=586398 RepID=A0AAV2GL03_9ROSI
MGKRKKVNDEEDNGACSTKYFLWPEHLNKPFADCILECFEKGLIVYDICKNGVYGLLARMMEAKVPGCGVKAKPHVEGLNKKPFMVYDALTPVFCKGHASGDHGVDNNPICLDETLGKYEGTPNIAFEDANEGFGRKSM